MVAHRKAAMSNTMELFYLARAADATRDAEAATLAHVRERWLRSATTWTDLAVRAGRTDKMRTRIADEKAAARDEDDSAILG
jgi:hypothetical protein